MPDLILVIGESEDAQLRLVVETLRAHRAPFLFLDLGDPGDFSLTLDASGPPRVYWEACEFRVAAIWSRIKLPVTLGESLQRGDAFLRESEWMSFASGLSFLFSGVAIHPIGGTKAYNKIAQLEMARQAGFDIPPTSAFLGKAAAVRFFEGRTNVALKAINTPRLAHPTLSSAMDPLITTNISLNDVQSADDGEFAICPVMFQELIAGVDEFRVIAIGDDVYSYRVVDAPNVPTLLDRRIMRPTYQRMPADARISSLARKYLDLAALHYGVFDLLVDAERCIFLECNPEGQWHSANEINVAEVIESFSRHVERFSASTLANAGKL